MKRYHRNRTVSRVVPALVIWLLAAVGCQAPQPDQERIFLIRVAGSEVSVLDYLKAVELAKAAYSHSELQDSGVSSAIQLRVLRELTEELILCQRAVELGISVTAEEVEEAERRIRADYPDKLFEETFLESAVSYPAWKERLKKRLLVAKVLRTDLESRIRISPEDVAQYYQEHKKELEEGAGDGGGSADINERIVDELRRQKSEQGYSAWVEELQKKYRIEINLEQWQQLSSS